MGDSVGGRAAGAEVSPRGGMDPTVTRILA